MNLLQGDHTAVEIYSVNFLLALGFHRVGIPWITLANGLDSGWYSFQMADILGDKKRAEL